MQYLVIWVQSSLKLRVRDFCFVVDFRKKPHPKHLVLSLQLMFLGWCMAPVSWNGSNTIYTRAIRPFVLKYQTKIDQALDEVGKQVDKAAKQGT